MLKFQRGMDAKMFLSNIEFHDFMQPSHLFGSRKKIALIRLLKLFRICQKHFHSSSFSLNINIHNEILTLTLVATSKIFVAFEL